MAQHCFASISDTGFHCAYCITRNAIEEGIEMSQAYCNKHKRPCIELNYFCSSFIGYNPDWRMTDEEEKEMIEDLIIKTEKSQGAEEEKVKRKNNPIKKKIWKK